jgi:hypothetical protein
VQHIVNYLAENAHLNRAVAAIYVNDGGDRVTLTICKHLAANARFSFILVYTVPIRCAPAGSVAPVSHDPHCWAACASCAESDSKQASNSETHSDRAWFNSRNSATSARI